MSGRRRCQCRGRNGQLKGRHPTREKAEAVLESLRRKDGAPRMAVYPCPAGEGWHVGHARGLKADIRKAIAAGNRAAQAARRPRRRR